MIRKLAIVAAVALLIAVPMRPAAAQNNTLGGALIGGGIGAAIGGAATGKAGGAIAGGIIGAAAGAALGSQLEPRRGGYYWYNGRCWRRDRYGDYHRTYRRRCF